MKTKRNPNPQPPDPQSYGPPPAAAPQAYSRPSTGQAPAPTKRQKPWYSRWWATAIAAVIVLFGIINLSSGGEEPEAGVEARAEAEEPEADYFADAFPVFEPVTESGSGDSVISLPAAQGTITASHSGSANFVLTVLDENNAMAELPVNTIGGYEGTTAFGLVDLGIEANSLEITADGDWEVTFAPISEAPELEDPQEATGDGVYRYTGDAATWQASHDGESNFVVSYFSDDLFEWSLLVNEIGPYEGTVPVTAGPAVVVVNADGDWSLASN